MHKAMEDKLVHKAAVSFAESLKHDEAGVSFAQSLTLSP